MAITNHERVGKALELLKSGLGPFVERELMNAHQANAEVTLLMGEGRLLGGNPVVSWPEIVRLAGESASRGAEPAQASRHV